MSYSKEVMTKIKEIRSKIDLCEDDLEAINLQAELLELIQNTLNDAKFKESLIKGTPDGNS